MAETPIIILVEPQLGENIGSAARAMLNCGLYHLRLVNPRDGWPNEKANTMGAGAVEKLHSVQVFDTVEKAIEDCQYTMATTARPREMVKRVFTAESAAREAAARIGQGQKTGILFGPERTGLLNDDIALANAVITIPLNPEFMSLNLGQAVLITGYEWMRHHDNTEALKLETHDSPLAGQGELGLFLERLDGLLSDHYFFRNPDIKPHMLRNIRSFFVRADVTVQELNTMHGMISALRGHKEKPVGRLKK